MRFHVVDHAEQDDQRPGVLLNRSWWIGDLPRLMPLCRVIGHRPVVDGYGDPGAGGNVARWVACDRCGVRPAPQGDLDPEVWRIGQRYTGPLTATRPGDHIDDHIDDEARFQAQKAHKVGRHPPGPWPERPTGEIGGQVVVGKSIGGAAAQVKVGNSGSEHVLAASAYLEPLGFLAVHTQGFGQGIQRRLNPVGYDSRVIGVTVDDGRLSWKVWAKRDEWSRDTPRWQDGWVRIDPRDVLLGERRYSYETVQGPVEAVVRMPDGDDHTVSLTLQRQRLGRRRGRGTLSWSVSWESSAGIPIRNHSWKGDGVYGSAVHVTAGAVDTGRWPQDACAAIAADLAKDRSRYRWRPPAPAEGGTAQEGTA